MFRALRKYLVATNIVAFIFIIILQKIIRIFCIIEDKTCKNKNCTPENRCNDRCEPIEAALPTPPQTPPETPVKKGLKRIPAAMRKAMRNFGFGEGYFQIFVEEKQRNPPSKARLNAAVAEVKLNPN